MTGEQYRRWSRPFRAPARRRAVIVLNKVLTLSVMGLYPLGLLWLLLGQDSRLLRCILVPGSGFCAVSVFRRLFNAPRPYEALDITPLQVKDKQGQSFPSRHVFSCAVIAMTALWLVPPAGAVLLAVTALLAWCRVVLGVHWPRDVAAGAAIGLVWGIAGYYFI